MLRLVHEGDPIGSAAVVGIPEGKVKVPMKIHILGQGPEGQGASCTTSTLFHSFQPHSELGFLAPYVRQALCQFMAGKICMCVLEVSFQAKCPPEADKRFM